MVQVTVAEAKTQLSSLLDAVEAVVITHTPRQAHRRAGAAYPWA